MIFCVSCPSHRDRWGGVPAYGGDPVPDVLQRGEPHPASARLLHDRLALGAGRHHRTIPLLPLLLLVRKHLLLHPKGFDVGYKNYKLL